MVSWQIDLAPQMSWQWTEACVRTQCSEKLMGKHGRLGKEAGYLGGVKKVIASRSSCRLADFAARPWGGGRCGLVRVGIIGG